MTTSRLFRALMYPAAIGHMAAQGSAAPAPRDTQTVVFVCEHGTSKSTVAMAYFNRLASERSLPLRAVSRGTAPEAVVPSLVRKGLEGDGLPLTGFTPTRLGASDLVSAIAVVSFDQPSVAPTVGARAATMAWDGLPALSDNFVVARDSIRNRVARLVDSLARRRQQSEWQAVEAAIGRPGVTQAGGVYRFNFPRTDLRVMVGDVQLKPALALGGWIAFNNSGASAIAVGDLVLLETEVNPVIDALQAGGVEQSAIHHHVLRESPRIIYVHVHGHGDAVKIAQAVHAAVSATAIPAPSPAAAPPADIGIDTAAIAKALGYSGRANGVVYQVSVPRAEAIRDGGMELPPSMGLSTAINFQPTGGGKAAITGDFVLLASEVNPVIRALRSNGIEVTSLHSHMLNEEPRLLFMHFWANDDAVKLARGLRAALDKTNSKR